MPLIKNYNLDNLEDNMIDKIITNKLYIASTLLLCILTYLLNYCTSIYGCALVFTIIAITVNVTTVLYGRFKGLIGLGFAAIIFVALRLLKNDAKAKA